MAASVNTSGSQTTTGSEDALATVTAAGTYQLHLDLANMADGATPHILRVRVYAKTRSGDTERLEEVWEFIGSQGKPAWRSPPVLSPHHYRASIHLLQGSNIAVPWAIYQA